MAAAGGMVRNSFHDNYGGKTQNLVHRPAFKHPCPNIERHKLCMLLWNAETLYLYATTRYIWMYIPNDSIDDDVVAVDEGYSGSIKDYFYHSVGSTIEASHLMRREQLCSCRHCLRL